MARTRTVKPEFWSDEKLAKLSRDIRLFYVGLWTVSDDYGVVKGHADWLKAQIFPYDNLKTSVIESWLASLEEMKRIIPFMANGEKFYFIIHFSDHQKVDHPSKQRNPEIPASIRETIAKGSRDSLDETETETETETNGLSGKPDDTIPFQEIINHLNSKTGQHYRASSKDTREHITARWKEGATLDEFKRAIDNMAAKWLNDPEMCQYLRPATLFSKGKFDGYVNQVVSKKEREGVFA